MDLFLYISTYKGVLRVQTKAVHPINAYLGVEYTIYTYFTSFVWECIYSFMDLFGLLIDDV